MTITLAGSTGVSTTAAARGTTSTTVAYTAVAAGRLAIITAVVKPSTATWGSAPAGWTLVTDATGGTGTAAADTGTSRIGKWYRILDGTETGSVTITAANSPSAVAASMDVYAKTRGSWATPISVTGADTTQGTNPTAASGTWAEALNVGDFVHVGYATNTDVATAITAQAISQTGTTFGATTARSRVGNTSGFQNTVFTYDAAVTGVTAGLAAGTGAMTMTVTWAATSSGAFGALRIREYDSMLAVTDNFDDGVQNANLYGPDSYGTFSETGGRMRVAISTTYSAVYSVNKYRFDDVYFRAYPAPGNGAVTEAYSAFWLDSKSQADGTTLGFFYDGINDQLYLASWVGYSDASQVILNGAAAAHPHWRLLRSGGNVLWQTSTDGSTWTTQRTAAMPTWVANGTDLAMWWEGHRADGTANNYEVDNLNITAALVKVTSGTATANATTYATTSKRATRAASGVVSATAYATSAKRATVARTAIAEATATATAGKRVPTSGSATAGATATASRSTVRPTAASASAQAIGRATSGKRATLSATATATVGATAATTRRATTIGVGPAAATARATSGRRAPTAGSAVAQATARATAARRAPTIGSATAAAGAQSVSAGRRPTMGSALATARATAASGSVRHTSGRAALVAVATSETGANEDHETAGTATAQVTARSVASKRATRSATAAASATARANSSTARITAGRAVVEATARSATGSEEIHTTAGAGSVTATARSSSTTRRTTSGVGVVVATARAAGGGSEQHTATGRATAAATARASSTTRRTTTGQAAVVATAYGRPPGGSGRPPITSTTRPGVLTSTTRPGRLVSVGRSSRITTSTRRPPRVE